MKGLNTLFNKLQTFFTGDTKYMENDNENDMEGIKYLRSKLDVYHCGALEPNRYTI